MGGKDNYEVDRRFMTAQLRDFPGALDTIRQNRLFLYRAVRFLTAERGIRQFIDMGCGLPTDNNVHQVAARFTDDARVVYVDVDPIVLAHGRAMLAADDSTSVITADIRDQESVLVHDEVARLIDFSEPVAVLFLAVGHHLVDAADPRAILRAVVDRAAAGSYLAFSQIICEEPERGQLLTSSIRKAGIPWQTRTPAEVDDLLSDFKPVEPGLVNVVDWRPLPGQPPLAPVPHEIAHYDGASRIDTTSYEYGGVLQAP
ncbi:SAM-dependent methyltransferase [Pseudonocardia sp. GCM10023141]|uniref:SAM-dependent methyltransferase n=1 Tax=Pseudonocardia sp. GCM10023141 TaxID=3252653 RepID=UPI003605D056